jgi:PAS domain S-box-containing protein
MPSAAQITGVSHPETYPKTAAESAAAAPLVAALAASEARLRGVLDAGFDAFVIARAERADDGRIADFRIVDVNARACAIAGRERHALLNGSLLEAFPRSREWGLWEQCCMVVITGQPLENTQFAPTDVEPMRWLQRQLVPVDGDAVAISSRDITERQRERFALEASEARHRQLFENSGAIQMLVEVETGRLVDVNPAAVAFYGWARTTMAAMYITDLESVSLAHWRELTAGIATGTGLRLQRDHRLATGAHRQVEVFVGAAAIAERPVLHLNIHDVSDQLRTERELRESEARFRAVIAGMREGVVLHDETGAIRMHNPSAERILGLTADQLSGLQPIDRDWNALRADSTPWPTTEHPALVALRTGRSQPRQLLGVQRGDGKPTWLAVTADPLLRAGETHPYASLAVFTDVTQDRESEERLREAQKLEAVAQLAGGIGHDFNNLLTVVRGAAGFLREGLGPTSPHLDDIAVIERATERAEELTRSLLAVGRRQMLRSEPLDLNRLAMEHLPILRTVVPPSIKLRLSLSHTPVTALLDRTRMVDVLRNLVDNAIAAMPEGGSLVIATSTMVRPRPHPGAQAEPAQPFAVLEVRDSGIGMNEETRQRLFEPFFSTQPFGSGRGMGLASVHGMVHQSQGFIECESAPEAGTTVRLFFPLSATSAPSVTEEPMVVPSTASGGVLLVDDDLMLRELGRRMLERLGDLTYVMASAEEAVEFLAARAAEVSLVVTDLTMPGMSGLDLLAHLAERYPCLPAVAISGFAVNRDARALLAAQRVPYVAKPFTIQELAAAMAMARGRRTG